MTSVLLVDGIFVAESRDNTTPELSPREMRDESCPGHGSGMYCALIGLSTITITPTTLGAVSCQDGAFGP